MLALHISLQHVPRVHRVRVVATILYLLLLVGRVLRSVHLVRRRIYPERVQEARLLVLRIQLRQVQVGLVAAGALSYILRLSLS